MRIRVNPNKQVVEAVRDALEMTGGYCPCALVRNKDTKCMCKKFREQIKLGIAGECHCGLYEGVEEND